MLNRIQVGDKVFVVFNIGNFTQGVRLLEASEVDSKGNVHNFKDISAMPDYAFRNWTAIFKATEKNRKALAALYGDKEVPVLPSQYLTVSEGDQFRCIESYKNGFFYKGMVVEVAEVQPNKIIISDGSEYPRRYFVKENKEGQLIFQPLSNGKAIFEKL